MFVETSSRATSYQGEFANPMLMFANACLKTAFKGHLFELLRMKMFPECCWVTHQFKHTEWRWNMAWKYCCLCCHGKGTEIYEDIARTRKSELLGEVI